MRVVDRQGDRRTLKVAREELRAMICSLGESLEVIDRCVYESRMGAARQVVKDLIDEFDVAYRKRGRRRTLRVSTYGLVTVKNALRVALEIDDCEFGTRMGFTKEEIRDVLAEVGALVAQ